MILTFRQRHARKPGESVEKLQEWIAAACRWRRKMGPNWRVEKDQWCGYGMADGEAGKTGEAA